MEVKQRSWRRSWVTQPLNRAAKDLEARSVIFDSESGRQETGICHTTDYGFFLKHWSRYQAKQNYDRKQIRKQLTAIWEKQGYQITQIGGKNSSKKEERDEIRIQLAIQDAQAFAGAKTEELSLQTAREILAAESSKPAERLQARKKLLEDKLPGTPLDSPEFVLKVLVANRGEFLRKAEKYWLRLNPEAAKWIDRWANLSIFETATKRDEWFSPKRLSIRSAQAELLAECPLEPFVTGEVGEWGDDTAQAIAVKNWALERKEKIQRSCRKTIKPTQGAAAIVNKLLKEIGILTKETRRVDGRGKQKWLYQAINLQDLERDEILDALSERFQRRFQEKEGSQNLPKLDPCPNLTTKPTEGDRIGSNDCTPYDLEALADVREFWFMADSAEGRRQLRETYGYQVLRKALNLET